MTKQIFLLTSILILALVACNFSPKKQTDPEFQYLAYCGSCHLAPDPANIPKSIWEDDVLPEMAARLGYKYNKYNPLAGNSMEEILYINLSNVYPNKSIIDSTTWQQIHDYVIALAPDAIPIDTMRSKRNSPITQFKPTPISLDENDIAAITSIQFNSVNNQFIIGDAYGKFFQWPEPFHTSLQFDSPLMSYIQKEDGLFVTEIGYMNPSEKPLGAIYRIRSESTDTLAKGLHRPVYTEIVDLNDDGKDEILICEFGNLTGELSLLVQSDSGFEKRTLLPIPGTIKVEIADMNDDGKKDIVVLASQGNEGVFILYEMDDLQYSLDQVIKLGPEYGSSWFELIDYNGDNHLDIVLANGDNADYSIFPKPYHGLRLFLNDGKNGFEEKWFYPIYGVTRVLAEDYDLDGDLDFAAMAFFPEYGNSPEESFVLLENKDHIKYLFEPHTFQESLAGRWLVMENGDFDQDGDVDILLGSFMLPLGKKYMTIMDRWRKEKVDLLLLENKAKN